MGQIPEDFATLSVELLQALSTSRNKSIAGRAIEELVNRGEMKTPPEACDYIAVIHPTLVLRVVGKDAYDVRNAITAGLDNMKDNSGVITLDNPDPRIKSVVLEISEINIADIRMAHS